MLPPPTPTDRQFIHDPNAEKIVGHHQQYQLALSYRKRPRPTEGFSSSSEDDETENRPQHGHENHQHEMNEERLHFLQRRQYHLQHQLQQPNQRPHHNDNIYTHNNLPDSNHHPEVLSQQPHRESRKRPREVSCSIPTQVESVQQRNAAPFPSVAQHHSLADGDGHHHGEKRVKLLSSLSALSIQAPTAHSHIPHQQFQEMGEQPSSLWQMNQLLHQLHQERCSRRTQEISSLSNNQHHNMIQSSINQLFPSPQLSLQAPSTSSSSQYDSNDTPANDAMDDD